MLMVFALGVTVVVLAYCSDVNKDRTCHGIVLSMCGPRWRFLVAVSVLLTCYGVCVTYLLVLGDQFDRLFASFYGQDFCHKWYMSRQFTISIMAFIFVMPLCFLRRINYLQYASSLGIVAVLYPCFLTVFVYYTTDVRDVVIKTAPTSYMVSSSHRSSILLRLSDTRGGHPGLCGHARARLTALGQGDSLQHARATGGVLRGGHFLAT
uniref:Putative sodium-coupled neutral amino acid transporter 7-like protein n=1 Tax=Ixodes ricinus TaxID=34613 RepID=V5H7Q5_IXORI